METKPKPEAGTIYFFGEDKAFWLNDGMTKVIAKTGTPVLILSPEYWMVELFKVKGARARGWKWIPAPDDAIAKDNEELYVKVLIGETQAYGEAWIVLHNRLVTISQRH